MRLRIGGAVLHMSPAGSYFCRAMSRRMIHDSTMATRAADGTGWPRLSVASARSSSFRRPPRTFSRRWKLAFRWPFVVKSVSLLCEEEMCGAEPSRLSLGREPDWRLPRSMSQRRCCSASACMRLKRCAISTKKASCSRPMLCAASPPSSRARFRSRALAVLARVTWSASPSEGATEGCRYGLEASPLASKAMAMHAPSSHFAPILCTASSASQ
mmetsp:Transcript_11294/g.34917  ORF Transcript_11294/g.34917 Transcript_11294/m.34917 type:complete len:214 (+) Transcript_11294:465-1106(+)